MTQHTLDSIAATLAALQIQIAALKGEAPAEAPALGILQGSPYEGGKKRRYIKFAAERAGLVHETTREGDKDVTTTLPENTFIKGVLKHIQFKRMDGDPNAKEDWKQKPGLGLGFCFDCGDHEVILSSMRGTQCSISLMKSLVQVSDLRQPIAVFPKEGDKKNVVWVTVVENGQNIFTKEAIGEFEALTILQKRGITLGGDIPPELGGTSTQQSTAPFAGVQPQAQQSPWQDWLMSNKANLEKHYGGISIPVEDIKTIIGDVLGTAGARAADIQTEDQAQSVYQAMAALAASIAADKPQAEQPSF